MGGRLFGPPTRTQGYRRAARGLLSLKRYLDTRETAHMAHSERRKDAIFSQWRPYFGSSSTSHVEAGTSSTAAAETVDEAVGSSATRARGNLGSMMVSGHDHYCQAV